jgi:Uncharacterised protein family (UPF0236)
MEFSTYLAEGLIAAVERLIRTYEGERTAGSLAEMEQAVQSVVHRVGCSAVKEWLDGQEAKYPAEKVACDCGKQAQYVRQRAAVSITLHGKITYRRAYYLCECGQGQCPLDQRLAIEPGQMSAELKTLAALFGVQEAYATSRTTLARLLAVELSPNSIRAACQEAGAVILAEEAALLKASQDLHRQTATQRHQVPPERIYLAVDGFQAPFEDGWHEMKAGMLWTTDAKQKAHQQQYFVDTATSDDFAKLVWAKAWQQGADLANQLVILGDGSAWIWHMAKRLFPNAIHIVDAFHAASYLGKIAADAFGEGTPDAIVWFEHHKALLHAGHLAELRHACRTIRPKAPTASDAARRYFANHRTRLRYPKYRALGLQIGSGVMDSACKQIGLPRLKLAGARWSEDGARKLAKARAFFLCDKINFAPFTLPLVA